jgi:hypothetical protein
MSQGVLVPDHNRDEWAYLYEPFLLHVDHPVYYRYWCEGRWTSELKDDEDNQLVGWLSRFQRESRRKWFITGDHRESYGSSKNDFFLEKWTPQEVKKMLEDDYNRYKIHRVHIIEFKTTVESVEVG